ncbi:MAG: TolC family protein [Desulfonatronovibrionaceae bacterium]
MLLFSLAAAVLFGCLFPLSFSLADEPQPEPMYTGTMEMTISEAVSLALRHNRNLESAYLDRVRQRFNLRRDLTKFHPDLEFTLGAEGEISEDSTDYSGSDTPDSRVTTRSAGTSAVTRITQKLPTGAELSFVWDNRAQTVHTSSRDDSSRDRPLDSSWGVDFKQPLLKGGGIDYNTVSLEKARINEQEALRSLRDRVINTVTGVITDYRQLLNAYQDLKVQEQALENAHNQLELTQVLIETGRRASNEILQSEANVARQELALERARSSVDDAQLALLNRLNIGRDLTIIPVEEVSFRKVKPDLEECLEIAFERNADYLNAQNRKDLAELEIMQAENQRLWELSAEAGYRTGWHDRRNDPDYMDEQWNVGLALEIPLPVYGDAKYTRESPLLSARINKRKALMDIMTAEENLENQVRNAVKRVDSALKRVELARKTKELSEQSYEVSQLQFKLGRISNQDYIRDQDKLRDDRLSEIQAIITYENALTSLDQILATTLETWDIEFKTRRADLEQEMLGDKTWMLGD